MRFIVLRGGERFAFREQDLEGFRRGLERNGPKALADFKRR